MSRPVPGPMQAALDTRGTTMCLCWKVIRNDGLIFGFTDHDVPVTFAGVTYEASTSFVASAIEDQLGLSVSNLEVVGMIDSSSITEDDIAATRYDNASVTVYLVNYLDTTQVLPLTRGTIGQLTQGDLAFRAELRNLSQAFAQYVGALCTPRCRVIDFGGGGSGLEAGCQADKAATVRAGVIAGVTNRKVFSIVPIGGMPPDGTGGTKGSGFYARGTVKFTSGNNVGLVKEIFTQSGGINFILFEPMPLDIAPGDTISLTAGCDRSMPVCGGNWNQIINRRAEDYVPGADQVYQVHT